MSDFLSLIFVPVVAVSIGLIGSFIFSRTQPVAQKEDPKAVRDLFDGHPAAE